MRRQRLRVALTAMLGALVLALAVGAVGWTIWLDRSRQAASSLADIARAVDLPAGSTPFTGVSSGCPTGQFILCGQNGQDVDTVAQQMQATLSVVAEEEAGLSCTTLPSRRPGTWRSCLVRIDRSGHAVLITIDPGTRLVDGVVTLDGAQVRIMVA